MGQKYQTVVHTLAASSCGVAAARTRSDNSIPPPSEKSPCTHQGVVRHSRARLAHLSDATRTGIHTRRPIHSQPHSSIPPHANASTGNCACGFVFARPRRRFLLKDINGNNTARTSVRLLHVSLALSSNSNALQTFPPAHGGCSFALHSSQNGPWYNPHAGTRDHTGVLGAVARCRECVPHVSSTGSLVPIRLLETAQNSAISLALTGTYILRSRFMKHAASISLLWP